MILYDAADVKVGSEQVIEVRAGTELVWQSGSLWTFAAAAVGVEIELTAGFSGGTIVDWGDGDTDTLTSGVSVTHTY